MTLDGIVRKAGLFLSGLLLSTSLLFSQTDIIATPYCSVKKTYGISNNKTIFIPLFSADPIYYELEDVKSYHIRPAELTTHNFDSGINDSIPHKSDYPDSFDISSQGDTVYFVDGRHIVSYVPSSGDRNILFSQNDGWSEASKMHVDVSSGNIFFFDSKDKKNWRLCVKKPNKYGVSVLFEFKNTDFYNSIRSSYLSENGKYILFQDKFNSSEIPKKRKYENYGLYILKLDGESKALHILSSDHYLPDYEKESTDSSWYISEWSVGSVSNNGLAVYTDKSGEKSKGVYLYNYNDGSSRQISPDKLYCFDPVISDNGKYLAFNAYKRNDEFTRPYVLNIKSGELKIIDRNAGNTDLRFSPNGRNIFYSAWKWGQIRLLCVDNPVITKKAKRKGEIVKF